MTANSTPWDLAKSRRVRAGTCSWTDKSMITPGLFYPAEVKTAADRLKFYADNFPIVEVDSTYYGLPAERNAIAWAERTPEDFKFSIKAFSLLTGHPTRPNGLPKDLREQIDTGDKKHFYERDVPQEIIDETWGRFTSALKPLSVDNKLRSVLFQFPKWFGPSRANREKIICTAERLAETLPGVACAIEFRSAAWLKDSKRTLDFLADHALVYVCVDGPQGFASSIPPIKAATADLAVIRFHGRRSETWDKRNIEVRERFKYDYSHEELEEWVPGINELQQEAQEVHVLMNNCYADYAVKSARNLANLLTE